MGGRQGTPARLVYFRVDGVSRKPSHFEGLFLQYVEVFTVLGPGAQSIGELGHGFFSGLFLRFRRRRRSFWSGRLGGRRGSRLRLCYRVCDLFAARNKNPLKAGLFVGSFVFLG